MTIDPESFRGKLVLLVIDKIVIGAIIALAFVFYDNWKTRDEHRYTERSSQLQLDLERARVTRDLVPVISSPTSDIRTKAYLLKSAIASGVIDSDSAFDLGGVLLDQGLDPHLFARVLQGAMPTGVSALLREADERAKRWQPKTSTDRYQQDGDANCNHACRRDAEIEAWRLALLWDARKLDRNVFALNDPKALDVTLPRLILVLNNFSVLPDLIPELYKSDAFGLRVLAIIANAVRAPSDGSRQTELNQLIVPPRIEKEKMWVSNSVMHVLHRKFWPFDKSYEDTLSDPIARVATLRSSPDWNAETVTASRTLSATAFGWLAEGVCNGQVSRDGPWRQVIMKYVDNFEHDVAVASNLGSMQSIATTYSQGVPVENALGLLSLNGTDVRLHAETVRRVSEGNQHLLPDLETDPLPVACPPVDMDTRSP